MTVDSTGDAAGNYRVIYSPALDAGVQDARMSQTHSNNETLPSSSIAICSMAFRLPAGVKTDERFWEVLSTGQDLRAPIPASRFNADGFDDSLGDASALKAKHGYFLNEDLASLDASFFSMTEKEISSLDPQIRQLLELTRECLESAGESDFRGKNVGCYIGAFSDEWSASSRMDLQHYDTYSLSGSFDIFMANKVSYEFDFKGPSMVIKTGCSASGVALHEACRALQTGDCTAAIVGGVSLITGPYIYNELNALTALSSEGSCKTFDAAADGFARGEAINVIYLKKLTDAIRDNNPIRAIIRNTGTNSDGKGGGTLAPNCVAQEALIRQVYDQVGLDPADTPFVECHGTGTPTGDPIETTAVGRVFREGAYIGSVKPNVGHSEAASALTSLIKAVLSLEHRTIPPNIKFNTPNPKIPFRKYGLVVPTKSISWPEDKQRRISINSFGLGGSNMHMIVEACPQSWNSSRDWRLNDSPLLLLFSANSKTTLQKVSENVLGYHSAHADRAADMAYTLACRREMLPTRSFAVVSSGKASTIQPPVKVPDVTPSIAMVFTGQGAQWPMMGHKLIESDPAFRRDMLMLDIVLQQCSNPPTWSVVAELAKPPSSSRMYEAEISQPLCTAIQIGLVNAFRRAGIEPAVVIGHSSGEIAAAYAARGLSLKEAILVAYYRGFVSKTERQLGGMAAVGMDSETTSKFLSKGVVVAAENSPQSTTISGDLGALDETIVKIKQALPNIVAKKLKVDMAYHSHQMIPIAKLYEELLRSEFGQFGHRELQCSFYSTVTGKAFKGKFDPSYWAENMSQTVKFSPAVQELLKTEAKNLIVMEVGPHSQLAGPLRQISTHMKAKFEYFSTLLRDENCAESILSTFGRLFQYGVKVKFSAMIFSRSVLSDLPAYPWDHSKHYWKESLLSKTFRSRQFPHHSLLGLRVLASTPIEPSWRNVLDIRDVTWIKDHKVYGRVIFPFACYVAMAGEAIRQLNGGSMTGYTVTHVGVQTPLIFDDGQLVEMITTLKRQRLTDSLDSDAYEFTIMSSTSSDKDSQWKKHCYGTIKACSTQLSAAPDNKISSYSREISSRRWYDAFERKGYNFGPEFRTLSNMSFDTMSDRAAAEIINPDSKKGFMMDPTVIDACLQLVVASSTRGLTYRLDETVVPTVVEEMSIFHCDAKSVSVDAWILDKKTNNGVNGVANGKMVIQLKGLTLSPIPSEIEKSEEAEKLGAARLEWTPDFDFIDYSQIIDPPSIKSEVRILLKELVELCILESHDQIHDLGASNSEHLNLYREWMGLRLQDTSCRRTDLERSIRIQEIFCQIHDLEPSHYLSKAVHLILNNVEDIFVGNISPLELLTRDGLLVDLYTSFTFRLSRFVKHLSDSKPRLRILEIGAGTGGGTNLILQDLIVDGANPPYEQYTFTDVSSGFFGKASERFSFAPNMEYKTFDISLPPAAQGFEEELGTYDLVVGFFVVHATPNLKETLQNIKQLLRPDGHLVICETSPIRIFSRTFSVRCLDGGLVNKTTGNGIQVSTPNDGTKS
ncbi:Highly reducing polyketide synthase atnH [Cladobotryum mycophilum]|uniref:Highly reducing polyketide synthase atnH n=1 Tax=Cladobotryum mycophilum TaxID=491253 RepID=A0ABR0SMW5_9HYPO